MNWTIEKVLALHPPRDIEVCKQPTFKPLESSECEYVLAVEDMKRHMTDEGWQIQAGLEHAGYSLCGRRLTIDETDVCEFLRGRKPRTIVMQDKREWECKPSDFRDKSAKFKNVHYLSTRDDIFKLTILKDSHQRNGYHKDSADELRTHAWIIYYHPRIVHHLAPFVRPQHLIRTYHTVDSSIVPPYSQEDRDGCLLSGAISRVYPLRTRLHRIHRSLKIDYIKHPGYHNTGCCTPAYLELLSHYKVAICTASHFGYALRKIIEATACGCKVITDLPLGEDLPYINGNLIRVDPTITYDNLGMIVYSALKNYNPDKQREYATVAKDYYDYRNQGMILAANIEEMRRTYNQ